jgi:tetratricopeptide (TPR) repeat protein
LEEYTRQRVPLDWAMVESNLGNALVILGKREGGTVRLEQAVTAYRAALQERRQERMPLEWAGTQYGLGGALAALGKQESGTARLEEAVVAYDAALAVYVSARADRYAAACRTARDQSMALLNQRRR